MQKWAESELQQADLGDARRNKRLVRIVEDLASQPASSVPQACGDIAATSAAYDFWNSPYFQPSDIRNAHIKSTIERIKEHQVILAIQVTTRNCSAHKYGISHLLMSLKSIMLSLFTSIIPSASDLQQC
jgi:hypothetical protein